MRNTRAGLTAGIVFAAGTAIFAQPAWAEDGTATFRLEGFAGAARDERPLTGRDTDFSGGALPSVAFDLAKFVVQLDGMAASHLGNTMLATAGHVGFKPSGNLTLGVYAAYSHLRHVGGLDSYRVGAEAAYHGRRFSLSGIVGHEHIERRAVVVGAVPGSTVVDIYGRGGSIFSMADITYYPDESVSLSVGHRYVGGRHAAALGAAKAFGPVSIFAEGRAGGHGYNAAWGGLRLRFGKSSETLQQSEQSVFANRLKDELFVNDNARQRTQVPAVVPPVVVPPIVVPPVVEPPAVVPPIVVPPVVVPPPPPPPPPETGGTGCACGATYCGGTSG
jgi:hypothetical protein